MWLREIEADRLRNLRAVSVGLSAGLTVVAGRNGQGKSSLLEAIYLLGTSRSFRTRQTPEIQNWNGGPLRVAGQVSWRGGEVRLAIIMDGVERGLLVDGVERDLESYLGRIDLVDLTAERMKVLRGGPDERRRFLDRGLVGLQTPFLRALADYRRTLGHRNALLRRLGPTARKQGLAEIEAWDDRLAKAGGSIHLERRKYAVLLSGQLGVAGRMLFSEGEELVLGYQPSPRVAGEQDPAQFRDIFRDQLDRHRDRDLALGFTGIGPHRDDLRIDLDGVDLRRFGSAGQVRAAMVALKIGKLALLRERHGEAPLFLMDDFDTDLDETRAAALTRFLHEGGFQAVVATSKERMMEHIEVPFLKIGMRSGEARPA